MTISFNTVPTNIRIPFIAAEFSATNATQGPALLAYKGLIIGQKTSAGTATANTIVPCVSVPDAIAKGGRGSMLHRQAIGWFASNKSTPVLLAVLADDGSGVAATGTIVVTGPATATGTISLYIGGVLVTVGVNSGDASTAIATAINAAINAAADLPVTAGVSSSTVTLTFRHKGLVGNSFDVRANYNGESLPAGVALAITALGGVVAGTVNPALATMFAALAPYWAQIWTHPYTDATSLTAIENELATRSGPMVQLQGLAITCSAASLSAVATLGEGRNSPNSCILAQPGANPVTPPMEFAAEAAALVALYGQADPARPFQTLTMSNALPPAATDIWTPLERNTLLYDGIATTSVAAGNAVQLERVITTYQTSPSGAPDTAYLDATTLLTLLYLRYSFRVRMQNKYPRHKLADDGTRYGAGQAVITPLLGKAEAVNWFADMEELGLVQDVDTFKSNLVVERHSGDPNRLDFLLPPELVGQLVVVGAQIAFVL